ncbi:MAG TPA: nitroreductase/quinone reductase family protein [Candidatus Dormibacteraeota bacterium]|nr:nitroreductase/quinone reductase family protein [Candidatus Dormibacteraeota bacterium]
MTPGPRQGAARGAKSGDGITTPLVYGRDGDDYVVVASKGGAPENPQWFGNIKANPIVDIDVADNQGTAVILERRP